MTYAELLTTITAKLKAANVPEAASDAWRLFEGLTGFDRTAYFMHSAEQVSDASIPDKLYEQAKRRAEGCPVQYIIGYQDFYGTTIEVSGDTLIPRFDTELIAEFVAQNADNKKILDMCTGTGCILIAALAASKGSTGIGCDISTGAVALAERNAKRNGVSERTEFFAGDLFEALKGTEYENAGFDIIVSNPPYIKTKDIEELSETVKDFEPRTALDGHSDGLFFYEKITKCAPGHLTDGGLLVYEIGFDQGNTVPQIMRNNGFTDVKVIKDLAGLDRMVVGKKGN